MSNSTLPEHLSRPALRRIHPVPLQKDNQLFLGLQDPLMLSGQMMVVPPPAFQVMQLFNGERSIEEICTTIGAPDAQPLQELVTKLDEFGLLWGPTCEALEDKKRAELSAAGAFPATATRILGDDPVAIRAQLEKWLDEAEDAEIEEPIVGLVSTHLDYARGHPLYAASYRTIAKGPKPDRIVILGSNHFGIGDGAIVSDLAFDSPLGRVSIDRGVVSRLRAATGEKLFKDVLDLLPESSIQFQLPWIQHLFGDVPVVAAIVPDPVAGLFADDGARLGTDDFITELGRALDAEGGRTLFIASADLSRAGQAFGEPAAVDAKRRKDVEMFDRQMLSEYIAGADKFVAKMREQKNPMRWTSVGALVAASRLARPKSVEMIDYRQAVDEQGVGLISSAAMALLG
jgi:AmmeMemoRadiSam system protein B